MPTQEFCGEVKPPTHTHTVRISTPRAAASDPSLRPAPPPRAHGGAGAAPGAYLSRAALCCPPSDTVRRRGERPARPEAPPPAMAAAVSSGGAYHCAPTGGGGGGRGGSLTRAPPTAPLGTYQHGRQRGLSDYKAEPPCRRVPPAAGQRGALLPPPGLLERATKNTLGSFPPLLQTVLVPPGSQRPAPGPREPFPSVPCAQPPPQPLPPAPAPRPAGPAPRSPPAAARSRRKAPLLAAPPPV